MSLLVVLLAVKVSTLTLNQRHVCLVKLDTFASPVQPHLDPILLSKTVRSVIQASTV